MQLPLALPSIFAGVNQTIMMSLAMVVVASMIGVKGLGQPVLKAITNQYFTMGLMNGLARALATDADILLMDEAFSALDPLIRTEMQDMLLDLQSEFHKTIVFITHDLDEALKIGDYIAILNDGEMVQ